MDVLVAGAGAAGTAAALAAADHGRTVVLVEANESFRRGSNTAMSTSMVPAGGSRWQRDEGIDDSPDDFLADVMAKTNGHADEVVARALVDVAPRLVAWLADDCGVPLALVTDFRYPGHHADRCHAVADRAGATLHGHLLEAVAARDTITLMVPMRLATLEAEEADGTFTALLETPDGTTQKVTAGAVVLATNGFGADQDLVAELLPDIAGGVYHGGDGSTGDALRIGEDLGLDTGFLDAYQGHGSLAVPDRVLLTWAFVMHGGVLVNVHGDRFGDETVGYSEFGPAVVGQPEQTAWAIFDERIHGLLTDFKDYNDLLDQSAVRFCDDVDEVSAATGIPVATVGPLLDEVASYARGDAEDPCGRTDFEAPLTAPYAVVQVTGALFHTQGGLRVDGRARVLRDGEPVAGLYAAGGAAVGISGHGADGYLAGNGLLGALGLGYLAGRDIGRST
ncbi:FAD-binding protein [Salsipaludibacter albus]|uniref:FAD-dependent oxidoreductase n=1 Tax=Salsipaludibacter albus TaxID=2849650 RepID=UPI001EE40C7E|nr:FAD-binding protein [Salsipaludibacter albus]